MAIKSHIQAPKSILSRFVNEELKKVFYLDVENGYIGLCGPGKIGQELGWYSDEIEKILNKNVETPLSGVCNKILGFMNGENDILEIRLEDVEIIKRYFITSIGRSEYIDESFSEHWFVKKLETQEKHNLMVDLSLNVSNIDCHKINELQWGIFHNRTSTNFILPRNCFYTVTDDESEEMIIMPISPKVAMGLFKDSYCYKYPSFKQERVIVIEEDDTINYMNSHAFQYEVVMNGKFAVSPRKKELEDVWDSEKEKYNKLKLLRNRCLLP